MEFYSRAADLAGSPRHTQWLSPILLAVDACLCALIITQIPCMILFPTPGVQESASIVVKLILEA